MSKPRLENGILRAWRATLARRGADGAIFSDQGGVLRSFSEIEHEAAELEGLVETLAPGTVAAIQIGNSERWPAVLLALWRWGCVPLPVGDHMQQEELAAALKTCGASARITIADAALRVERIDCLPVVWPDSAPDFLKLTSGTTSLPRALRFRASQLLADSRNICTSMGITDRDLNYGVIPFSHSYGFSNLITPLLCAGVPLVASSDRLPRAILAGIARTGATVLPGLPVFYQRMAELPEPPAVPTLRLCISAGAPLTRAVADSFRARFGLKVHTFYGASECGGIGYDASDVPVCEDGFVGTAMAGVMIAQPGGDGGSIEVRSEAVADGYFPDDDPASLGGGRFVPSDLIRRTDRGMVIAGRVSDVINIAGRKLNPLEVEARIASCPGVRQAVVFGVQSALRGEEPVACVAVEGLVRDDLLRHCHTVLSSWQMPRDVWIVPEIPVNERGKISRRELAAQYRARSH